MIDLPVQSDTLLVHSSFRATGLDDPNALIDALAGVCKTLIVPTFTWSFCQSHKFDVRRTPSECGLISELVRRRPDARRCLHGIYSFAAIGERAEEIGGMFYQCAFGKFSVFAKLREWNADIAMIGVAWNNSFTFVHHVEEMERAPWRVHKLFGGEVVNRAGIHYDSGFDFFVRRPGVTTNIEPLGEHLERAGLVRYGRVGNAAVKVINANAAYTEIARQIRANPRLFYEGEYES